MKGDRIENGDKETNLGVAVTQTKGDELGQGNEKVRMNRRNAVQPESFMPLVGQ